MCNCTLPDIFKRGSYFTSQISFYSQISVTLNELQTIADSLRPNTAHAMKIEVAPWIKEYVVDMEDLYTELALEKIHNKVAGQDVKILNNYSDLFDKHERNKRGCLPWKKATAKKSKGQKILMKADPGMGKTTQCKKISWDWAMKLFTYFHIVFFVFLKLVSPGDPIESVIIKQNPYMLGLEITEQKVRSILRLLGSNCLLILDGLDEHALGTNEDVLLIIRGEKYLECNIIVTSRPHSTRDIEQYFPTIARVEGFTKHKAKQFASKILSDESKINDVLAFSPSYFRQDVPIQKCPILLSFICLLVREDEIDLSDKTIHIGEIYTRMLLCLYKKFTIRRDIGFEISEFPKVLKSIGKLALKTLLSGNPLLQRSEVIKQVGSDAFDYGLLIGHEDAHRLIVDETADIWVTFPHRTIQEFLGALYFLLMLDEEQQIEKIIGKDDTNWIFMKNPLFLQFCLWLLHNGEKYFNFQRGQDMYNQLIEFCVTQLNSKTLDLTKYAALYVKSVYDRKDKLHLEFLSKIFAKCDRTSRLIINDNDPLDWVLNSMAPVLNEVTRIGEYLGVNEILISCVTRTDIVFQIHQGRIKELTTILEDCRTWLGNRSIYLYLNNTCLLSESKVLNLKRLFVKSPFHNEADLFLSFPHLTHLCLTCEHAREGTLCLFNYLWKGGHFPLLRHLSLTSCREATSRLKSLFQTAWPR